jgi:uncharacterized protein YneF (UPF0154 family)
MYRSVSSILTSSVKYECDNTATDDLSSAMEVLEYYCSAAESLVVATVTDVAEDAKETSSEASSRTVSASGAPSETGSSGNDDVGSSGGGNGDPNQDGSDGGDSNSDGSNDNGGISKGALIAIIVLGVIVVLGLIAGIAWFIRRKHTRAKAAAAAHPPHNPEPYTGMPELLGSDASESRVNIAKSVSPAITDHHPYGRPEMGGTQISELPPQQYRPELHGEAAPQQQQHQGGYAMPYGQPPPPPPPQELPSPVAYSPNSPHQQYQQPQYQQPQYQQQYPQQYQPMMGENNRPGEAIAMTPISPPTPSYHQQQNGWQSGPVGPYESHSHAR